MKKILMVLTTTIMLLIITSTQDIFVVGQTHEFDYEETEIDYLALQEKDELILSKTVGAPTTMALFSCPSEDQYEVNDNFDSATKTDYYQSKYATISDVPWYCSGGNDLVDYYYFTTTETRNTTITLSSLPANYNMKLFGEFGEFIAGSYNTGTTNETINRTLEPGSYFIKIYARTESDYDNYDTYRLYMSGPVVHSNGLLLDSQVKNTYQGAIWVSEYQPRGVNPATYDNEKLYSLVEGGTALDDFYMRMLTEEGLMDYHLSRVLYVWDEGAKEDLYEDVCDIINAMESSLNAFYPDFDDYFISIYVDSISLDLAIISLAMTSPAGTATATVSIGLATLSMMLPEEEISISAINLYGYYHNIKGALEDSPEGEVIRIREFFQVYREYTPNMPPYTISYDYFVNFTLNPDEHDIDIVYTGGAIEYYQPGSTFYGSITPLYEIDSSILYDD